MQKLHRWLLLVPIALGVAASWTPAQAATLLQHSRATNSGQRLSATPFSETPEASAPPEFGRCIKTPGGSYLSGVCTKTTGAGEGNYQWYSAFGSANPLEKVGFSNTLQEGTLVSLETVGKSTVVCEGENTIGEYTGNKTVGSVVVTFSTCSAVGGRCTSPGAGEGAIVTNALEGTLGVITAASEAVNNKIGEDLFPPGHTGTVAQFTCSGITFVVSGSVIFPLSTNTMKLTTTVKFSATKGKQKPERFAGEPTDVLLSAIGGGSPEQSGQTLTGAQTNEEKLEVNSVV
jgi:hypothetical protein